MSATKILLDNIIESTTTNEFILDDGSVVGQQNNGYHNIGLYTHTPQKIKCKYKHFGNVFLDVKYENKLLEYKKNDILRISRFHSKVLFSLNGEVVCLITGIPNDLVLYPCASLSYPSSVRIL